MKRAVESPDARKRNFLEGMTSAENFYQAFASLLLKPAEWPNPVRQFFVQNIKPKIDFEEQFFIKNGIEPGGKPHQQSSDTIRSLQALKRTLDWMFVKTVWEYYGIPATGFKPEHMPDQNAVEKLIASCRKIPGLGKLLQ